MSDVVISGINLETNGFMGLSFNTAGLGLNSWGFLFPCDEIWVNAESSITTTWEECSVANDNTEYCAD